MTSRERVLSAIGHKETRTAPFDPGATTSSSISAVAYGRLKRHRGMSSGHTRVYDVVQQLAQPEPEILDAFHVDAIDLGRAFNTADGDWKDVTLPNGDAVQFPAWFQTQVQPDGAWLALHRGRPIAKMPPGATFFDQTAFPWADAWPDKFDGLDAAMDSVLWAAFAQAPWDRAAEPGFWDKLRATALQLRQDSGRAIMLGCGCNLFEWGTFLRRIDNFLADLLLEEDKVEALLDALLERHLAFLAKVCAAVGDVVDVLRFGDDLGMDTGPFMSPDTYRKLFKPRHKTLCDYVKAHSSAHTYLHSCGSIRKLLPDLIEAGFEIVNPVQTNCAGMAPAELKREFGADLTFWGGGCDTRNVLNHASPGEVRDHVRRNLDILMPGGGFVFAAVHNIMPDVPPANIEAMFAAVAEHGA